MGPLRLAALAAAAAFAGAVAVPAAAQAAPPSTIEFHADSGDACPYGTTKGVLDGKPDLFPAVVAVQGAVADQPVSAKPTEPCADDRRFTTATFTLYSGRVPLAEQVHRADNASVELDFFLGPDVNFAKGDRVVVQVCRHSTVHDLFDYCGKPQEYALA